MKNLTYPIARIASLTILLFFVFCDLTCNINIGRDQISMCILSIPAYAIYLSYLLFKKKWMWKLAISAISAYFIVFFSLAIQSVAGSSFRIFFVNNLVYNPWLKVGLLMVLLTLVFIIRKQHTLSARLRS